MAIKKFTVTRGFTYSYTHFYPTSKADYIIFLHGFPSFARQWSRQIAFFSGLGYGIIAPDLLGYGETSQPEDFEDYRLKLISQDVVDILNFEKVGSVYGVGHDFGVSLLTRMEYYHPKIFKKLAFLTIGCNALGAHFDLDMINAMTKKNLGYAAYGYIGFFAEDDAVELLNSKVSSFSSLMFSEDHSLWIDNFGEIAGLRNWLENDRRATVGSWLSSEDQILHEEVSIKSGFAGPLQWYKSLMQNTNLQDEKVNRAYQCEKPVLLLLADEDRIAIPQVQIQMTEPYAPDLTVKRCATGHWIHMEAAEDVNDALKRFIER